MLKRPGGREASRFSLDRIVRPFAIFVERYYPDPFIFVAVLTVIVAFAALVLTDSGPVDIVRAWGSGLSSLMSFIAQITIMLVLAHALALTPPVARRIEGLAQIPKTGFQVYFLVGLVSGMFALFSWSFGLVAGAVLARAAAISAEKRGIIVHYPLVIATAYAGMAVWHMGYSGSAPLFVATPGHILEDQIGRIPVTETIFTLSNIITALISLLVIAVICPLMHPRTNVIRPPLEKLLRASQDGGAESVDGRTKTFGDRLNHMRIFTFLLGLGLTGYLVYWFWAEGLALDLNIVVWTILAVLLLVSRSPHELVTLVERSSKIVGPILLQYPFYAGIMGVMASTGLIALISQFFVSFATAETLSFWAFVSGGLINIFVPSGGGQWVVQGPMFAEAAKELGVDPSRIVMGVAYGDQWTNLIQPFWTLPMLAIAGLSIRDILGFCFLVLIATFFIFAGSLLLVGSG